MRKAWLWVAGALPVFLLVVYLLLPWYSAHQLVEAAQHQDLETMERYVDFPQLRTNIRQRLLAEVRASMEQDLSPEFGNLFSAGAELFLGPLVDSLISPRGIAELIQGQKDWREFERELESTFGGARRSSPPADTAAEPSGQPSTDEHQHHWQLQHWRFSGINRVEVFCGNRDDESRVQLFLQRNGFRWQLVDIRLIDEKGE